MNTGDLDAFLHDGYERVVRAVALATGDVDQARDAVQEALSRALDQERRGRPIEHLGGWVATVALNASRRRFRRRSFEEQLWPQLHRGVESLTSAPDVGLDLRAALRGLPTRQREAVVLHHLLDLEVAETARLLKVSEGTVKSALSRGRSALAVVLRPQTVEQGG